MKFFDFFKKKKKPEKKTERKLEKAAKIREKKPEPKRADFKTTKPKRKKSSAFAVLNFPHITEKATKLAEQNKYVFKVFPKSNKIEIKKAIESLYDVDVVNVRIINVPRQQRKLGRQKGWKKGYKKAVVGIKKGQKIEIMPR